MCAVGVGFERANDGWAVAIRSPTPNAGTYFSPAWSRRGPHQLGISGVPVSVSEETSILFQIVFFNVP